MFLDTLNKLIKQYRHYNRNPIEINTLKDLIDVYNIGIYYPSSDFSWLNSKLSNVQVMLLASILELDDDMTWPTFQFRHLVEGYVAQWCGYRKSTDEIITDLAIMTQEAQTYLSNKRKNVP
jgi:hypothetical protein